MVCALCMFTYDLIYAVRLPQIIEQGPSHTTVRARPQGEHNALERLCFPFCELGVRARERVCHELNMLMDLLHRD